MKKKIAAYFIVAAVNAMALAGCGGGAQEEGTLQDQMQENGRSTGEAPEAGAENLSGEEEEDLADITVSFWSLGTVPEEVELVEDAINEITEVSIHTTVHLNIMDAGTYIPNGAMTNGVANGEDYDVVLTAAALSGHYQAMTGNGMLLPIEELLDEYAPELLDTVPKEFLDVASKGGHIYAVPSYGNKVKNMYWVCRNEVLEGIGLDISTVKNVDDIEAAMLKIQEKYPDMTPLGGCSFGVNMRYPGFAAGSYYDKAAFDTLGESTACSAIVLYDDKDLKAVSRYETEAYKADTVLVKRWYDMGLVDKDIATDSATSNVLAEKANVASCFYVGQFNMVETLAGDTSFVKICDGVVTTSELLQFTWALPISCDEPEASARFLNLLFTDERIVNLLDYGVEGVHYEKKADGTIGFPEGVTAENSGYYMGGITGLVGNNFLSYPWEGNQADAQEKAKAEMDNATYSPLLGFTLDTGVEAISDIYAQLAAISNQEYGPALNSGSAPEGYYEEMLDKLNAAGLPAYVEEANRQLEAWKASQAQ